MHVYRFRLLFEDQEDFLRDFDILSSQTFFDFHNAIKQSVELPGNELASFFVCDRNWRKKKEITLINMQNGEPVEDDDDDDDRRGPKRDRMPISEMDKVRIKDVIDDPHQRLLFEYDFLNPRTFYIELTRILEAGNKDQYPMCVKSEGKLIVLAPILPILETIDAEEDEIALMSEFDDILDNDEEEDIPSDPTLEQSSEW
ncbi:MAG: hypothetical protein V1775_02570 [Bacteroidota bacterium]